MAYDEELAGRIRQLMAGEPGLTEKSMFGGLAFLVAGNMSVTASSRGGLMVRVDPDRADGLIDSTSAVPMIMRGREMTGWLHVAGPELSADEELEAWVGRGLAYARTLTPKG